MLKYRLGRLAASICRFGELRLARILFRDAQSPTLLRRTLFGTRFVLDVSRSEFHQLLFLQGDRTIPERSLVRQLLKPGMHVVDVGANIGYYVALVQTVLGNTGRISCFEPSPENLAELRANVSEKDSSNISVFDYAVGKAEGVVGLRNGVNSGVVSVDEGVFTSKVRPLDSVVQDRCDFLKIDVDGYECEVLEGAAEVIRRDRPILFLECHPLLVGRHGGSITQIMTFLQQHYSNIEAFDVPDHQSLIAKFKTRYLGMDPVRRIEVDGIPEAQLHEGRLYGTFWLVCLP